MQPQKWIPIMQQKNVSYVTYRHLTKLFTIFQNKPFNFPYRTLHWKQLIDLSRVKHLFQSNVLVPGQLIIGVLIFIILESSYLPFPSNNFAVKGFSMLCNKHILFSIIRSINKWHEMHLCTLIRLKLILYLIAV